MFQWIECLTLQNWRRILKDLKEDGSLESFLDWKFPFISKEESNIIEHFLTEVMKEDIDCWHQCLLHPRPEEEEENFRLPPNWFDRKFDVRLDVPITEFQLEWEDKERNKRRKMAVMSNPGKSAKAEAEEGLGKPSQ